MFEFLGFKLGGLINCSDGRLENVMFFGFQVRGLD